MRFPQPPWTPLVLLLFSQAHAQTPGEVPVTLRSETRVVEIDVTVRDSSGHSINDLTKDDFTVKDEGKPRVIQLFSVNRGDEPAPTPTPAPALPPGVFTNRNAPPPAASARYTAILLDTFNDYFDNYASSRDQVIRMLATRGPGEHIAVYVLNMYKGLLILQDYTTDRELLKQKLLAYLPSGMEPAPVSLARTPPVPMATPEKELYMRNGAEAARTAIRAISEHLAILPGRKTLLWVSQGFPPRLIRETSDTWQKTLDSVNQSNVALNAIDSNGLGGAPRRWGGNPIATFQELAERTGGKAYYHRNDLDAAMSEAIDASRTTYILGFYLEDSARDDRFHRLEVRVNRPHVELNYRLGYYAGADRPLTKSEKKTELDTALLSPVDSAAVGITAHAEITPGQPRGTLRIHANLTIKPQGGGLSGKFEEMFVQTGARGETLAKISDTREFHLTPKQRERLDREGLAYATTMPLVNGAIQLRMIVRDTETGQVGSLTLPLK